MINRVISVKSFFYPFNSPKFTFTTITTIPFSCFSSSFSSSFPYSYCCWHSSRFFTATLTPTNCIKTIPLLNTIPFSRKLTTSNSIMSKSTYSVKFVHPKNTLEHRVYFQNKDGLMISPFHDIPLFANQEKTILNMVVEIPRFTNAKLEISKESFLNPIQQDVKKGKLRYVANCFPYHGYVWNYGAFPQTWEDPTHLDVDTKAKGDNDPLDVCDLSERVSQVGEIKQVKVLGCMALLDEGETDWKILVIDVNDPKASLVHDIEDIETHFPGLLKATFTWFKIYKLPDGKPENQFAFQGQPKNKAYAMNIISQTHEAWKHLVQGKIQSTISCANTTLDGTSRISPQDPRYLALPQMCQQVEVAPVDPSVDKWHFVTPSSNL